MSRVRDTAPVPFTLPGGCECEGTPHPDGDVVYLRPGLSPDGGMAAQALINAYRRGDVQQSDLEQRLGMLWLHHGILSWNFLDDAGAPIPVTRENIDRLDWLTTAEPLSQKADELYGGEAFAPFLVRQAMSTASGQTTPSTSRNPNSNGKHPTRSTRSSRSTSAASRR